MFSSPGIKRSLTKAKKEVHLFKRRSIASSWWLVCTLSRWWVGCAHRVGLCLKFIYVPVSCLVHKHCDGIWLALEVDVNRWPTKCDKGKNRHCDLWQRYSFIILIKISGGKMGWQHAEFHKLSKIWLIRKPCCFQHLFAWCKIALVKILNQFFGAHKSQCAPHCYKFSKVCHSFWPCDQTDFFYLQVSNSSTKQA